MAFQKLGAIGLAFAMGVRAAKDMGPAAFMWPPDRTWSSETDNTPPCGSAHNAGNRTDFPLSGGKVAFVSQDDSYHVHLSISYDNDPQLLSDFETLINPASFAAIEPGHACIDIPNSPSNVDAGDVATLQIVYVADFDSQDNQTFYACADIKFVERSDFRANVMCFNATEEDNNNPHSPEITEFPGPDDGKGLSKGAVAGIVVGVVIAVGFLGAAGFFVYRSHRQKSRMARQLQSVRSKWTHDGQSQGGESASQASRGSIRMHNLTSNN